MAFFKRAQDFSLRIEQLAVADERPHDLFMQARWIGGGAPFPFRPIALETRFLLLQVFGKIYVI